MTFNVADKMEKAAVRWLSQLPSVVNRDTLGARAQVRLHLLFA